MYETREQLIIQRKKMYTWVPDAYFEFRPQPGGGVGGRTRGTKGKYSHGKHMKQRHAMPSYWVLQAQDTHVSNQNTLRGNSGKSKPTLNIHYQEIFQWPCSSFWIDLSIGSIFIQRYTALYYRSSMTLFLHWDCRCARSTVDLQRYNVLLVF